MPTTQFTPNAMYPSLDALAEHLRLVSDDNPEAPLSCADDDGLYGYVIGFVSGRLTWLEIANTLEAAREIIAAEGL